MQHELTTFDLCHLVVVDDGTPFKGSLITIYGAFNLSRDVLAKRNHKGLTVENFHRFINNSDTIAAEERDTNNILFPTGIATGHA